MHVTVNGLLHPRKPHVGPASGDEDYARMLTLMTLLAALRSVIVAPESST